MIKREETIETLSRSLRQSGQALERIHRIARANRLRTESMYTDKPFRFKHDRGRLDVQHHIDSFGDSRIHLSLHQDRGLADSAIFVALWSSKSLRWKLCLKKRSTFLSKIKLPKKGNRITWRHIRRVIEQFTRTSVGS
jgi:hypothetical protein